MSEKNDKEKTDGKKKQREEQSIKKSSQITKVILRDYSKMVLYYPLLIYSIIALIIQIFTGPDAALAIIWMFVFIYNTVAIGFNFPTLKFFLLFLSIIVVVMVFVLLDITGVIQWISLWAAIKPFFQFTLDNNFYGWIILITGVMIIASWISSRFQFIRIERNEVYVREIARGKANRYPTKDLKLKEKIIDVFEYITLGAGSITVELTADKKYLYSTVPFVKRKKRQIDLLLSTTLVEDVHEL